MYYLPHCSQLTSNYEFKGLLISTLCNQQSPLLFRGNRNSAYSQMTNGKKDKLFIELPSMKYVVYPAGRDGIILNSFKYNLFLCIRVGVCSWSIVHSSEIVKQHLKGRSRVRNQRCNSYKAITRIPFLEFVVT